MPWYLLKRYSSCFPLLRSGDVSSKRDSRALKIASSWIAFMREADTLLLLLLCECDEDDDDE